MAKWNGESNERKASNGQTQADILADMWFLASDKLSVHIQCGLTTPVRIVKL